MLNPENTTARSRNLQQTNMIGSEVWILSHKSAVNLIFPPIVNGPDQRVPVLGSPSAPKFADLRFPSTRRDAPRICRVGVYPN